MRSIIFRIWVCLLTLSTLTIKASELEALEHNRIYCSQKASKIIFRNYSKSSFIAEKADFQKEYPGFVILLPGKDELPAPLLLSPNINLNDFDRGSAGSTMDDLFFEALKYVAKLVDENKTPRVCDFGCGNGGSTFLFALTGADNVVGIERFFTETEFNELSIHTIYYNNLAKKPLGKHLSINIKKGDTRKVPIAPNNSIDTAFMGNFLHMFDPAAAKNIIASTHAILREGGVIFASVEGLGAKSEDVKKAYLQGVSQKKKFPSCIQFRDYYPGEIIQRAVFPADVNENGYSLLPCRASFAKEVVFNGPSFETLQKLYETRRTTNSSEKAFSEEELKQVLGELKTQPSPFCAKDQVLCFYDSELIKFIFPETRWEVDVKRQDYSGYNATLPNVKVSKWHITAFKK